jgi:hypothetical protein
MEKLSKLESDVLNYVALNPSKNMQQIQRGIDVEDKNYASVNKAVKRLKIEGYLQSKEGKSEKHVPVDFYSLSTFGLGFVLSEGSEDIILEAFKKNESASPNFQDYQLLIEQLKPSAAIKLLKITGKSIMQYGENAWLPQTIFIAANCNIDIFSPSELKQLKRAALKANSTKAMLKDAAKRFDNFLSSEEGVKP